MQIEVIILMVWSVACGFCEEPPLYYPTIVSTEEICKQGRISWAKISPDHRSECYVLEFPVSRVRVPVKEKAKT